MHPFQQISCMHFVSSHFRLRMMKHVALSIVIRIRVMTLTVQKQGQFLDFLLFLFKQTHKRITTTHQTFYQCFCKGKMRPQEMIFATHQTYYQ